MTTEAVAAPAIETTAPAAVAAPAAPSVPAVTPDPKPAAVPGAKEAPVAVSYETTGNTNADYALAQIGNAGIGPDHPAALAALEGDFSLLKHALAAAGVPGGDHLIAMLEKAAVEASTADEAIAKQITDDVVGMAGSQEHWDTVMSWGRDNADPAEKEALNKLFADTATHKIAAGYLLSAYDRAGGPKEAAQGVVSPDAGVASQGTKSAGGPLNRVQFAAEAKVLRDKMGDQYIQSAEYQALGRRLQR
jgi:hypothetical protein